MKTKIKDIDDIWKLPFGSTIFLTEKQANALDPDAEKGIFTYIAKDHEIGDLLVDEYGELFWSCGEIQGDVQVVMCSVEDLVKGFIRGLVAYNISLQDEPIINAEIIKHNEITIQNMRVLEDLLLQDQE